MFTQNAQQWLDSLIEENEKKNIRPRLLLHSCCAPCSSYVLEYLSRFFEITVYYYNPNIYPPEEFYKRSAEQARFTDEFLNGSVPVVREAYDDKAFYSAVSGLEKEKEGGERCRACFALRLEKTAKYAKEHGFTYFTTTLSISPHKNAALLNTIGGEIAEKYGVSYLFSDFKKKNGYLRSCTLSKEYGIYRQDYCGCVFSMREAEERRKERLLAKEK